MTEKWAQFSKRELCDIHHACDMLLKRPDLPREERLPLQALAAEAWAEHCRRLIAPRKIGTVSRSGGFVVGFVVPVLVTAVLVFLVLRLT